MTQTELTPQAEATPRGPEAEYFYQLAQGQLRVQQCNACAKHIFYPRMLCPHCGSTDLRWTTPSGRGAVYSYSVIAGKPGTDTDYNVVLVDLDEGVRMMSRLEGIANDKIAIGMPVQAKVEVTDGKGLVVFEPANKEVAA